MIIFSHPPASPLRASSRLISCMSILALALALNGCVSGSAHTRTTPRPPAFTLSGERVDTLLIDIVQYYNLGGRRRLTIVYDVIGEEALAEFMEPDGKHWEKSVPYGDLERVIRIVDHYNLAGAPSYPFSCNDCTQWYVTIRLNWRVHDFLWDSGTAVDDGRALREIFKAFGLSEF